MSAPTFFDTPRGEQLVILARADYDALLARASAQNDADDAADIAIAGTRMAEWEATGRPAYPLPVVKLLRDGTSVVRAFRKHCGLSQQQLAEAVGIGQGHLSDIEQGRKTASSELLLRLAAALRTVPASLTALGGTKDPA